MNAHYKPNIEMPDGSVPPDVFEIDNGIYPPPNLVVSRDMAGRALSFYGDNIWDVSFYSSTKRKLVLVFGRGEETSDHTAMIADVKFLLFCLIWIRVGAPLSFTYLRSLLYVLKVIEKFALINHRSIYEVLESEEYLTNLLQDKPGIAEALGVLLHHFSRIEEIKEIYRAPPKGFIKFVCELGLERRRISRQTAPIPPRIYAHFVERLISVTAEWQKNEAIILEGIEVIAAWLSCCLKKSESSNMEFRDLVKIFPPPILSPALIDYLRSRSRNGSWRSVMREAAYYCSTFKLIILAFTGMRRGEVDILPIDCLQVARRGPDKFFLINGFTTKYNNGIRKKTLWVAGEQVELAVYAAQRITLVLAKALYGEYSAKLRLPLFLSHRIESDWSVFKYFPPEYQLKNDLRKFDSDAMWCCIDENDLLDLEHIDFFRHWRAEAKFGLGERWPFSIHQLRRTLALYSHQSGIVSLPSLRRQLQHVTLSMTRFYSKGSQFSDKFLAFHDDHFGYLWRDTSAESQAIGYFLQVILADFPLLGGHGAWVNGVKRKGDCFSRESRESTLRLFRKGQIAYKETVIGGCTKVGRCEQTVVDWLNYECLSRNCKNLVIDPGKLNSVIKAQEKLVEQLPAESVEYRSELKLLSILSRYSQDRATK